MYFDTAIQGPEIDDLYIFLMTWYFLKIFYLFIHETHREREREREREKERERERGRDTGRRISRFHAGNRMWDSIPGLQDHTLG